jgi:hypothetical protein
MQGNTQFLMAGAAVRHCRAAARAEAVPGRKSKI